MDCDEDLEDEGEEEEEEPQSQDDEEEQNEEGEEEEEEEEEDERVEAVSSSTASKQRCLICLTFILPELMEKTLYHGSRSNIPFFLSPGELLGIVVRPH